MFKAANTRLLFVLAAASSLATMPARAQSNTIGDAIHGAMYDMFGPLVFIIAMVSFVGGLYLFVKGLLRLKDSSSGHGGASAGEALVMMTAAFCLILLPEMAGVGILSFFGDTGLFTSSDLNMVAQGLDAGTGSAATGAANRIVGMATVIAPSDCLASASSSAAGEQASCMARNIAQNAIPIAVIAVFSTGLVGGLFVFASCLSEMAKGDKHQQSPAFWGKVVGSILLMNAMYFFLTSTNTLLGAGNSTITENGVNSGSNMLSYTAPSTAGAALATYASLIGYCFVILTFFGAFAFVKGLFMVKDASEGRNQATITHGLVFIFAGILLANCKYTVCLVLTTVAGASGTAGFCS